MHVKIISDIFKEEFWERRRERAIDKNAREREIAGIERDIYIERERKRERKRWRE